MGSALRVLIGLLAGLALGIAAAASGWPWLVRAAHWVEPAGILFVNAIRVAVIPLVVASLVVGIAEQGDHRRLGRLGARALGLILMFLLGAAVLATAAGYPLLARLRLDPQVAANLTAKAAVESPALAPPPTLAQWITDLIPANVFKAANDGALLPLVVCAIGFGLAVTRVAAPRRARVVEFFHGVADALLVYIAYIVRWAPLGVFALAMPLAARVGWAAVGALAYYIVVLSAISAAFILLMYPATVALARVPLGQLVKSLLPAQAVAFSSRSSMAALPATYEAAQELQIPEETYGFFLPLAASVFRVGAVIAQIVGVLFLARLYGVPLAWTQLATVVATVIATSLTVPGIPAGAIIVLIPVLAVAGIPVEGIAVLLAVDTIPDMFRTTANVTGWLAVGSVLAREARGQGAGAVAAAPAG